MPFCIVGRREEMIASVAASVELLSESTGEILRAVLHGRASVGRMREHVMQTVHGKGILLRTIAERGADFLEHKKQK